MSDLAGQISFLKKPLNNASNLKLVCLIGVERFVQISLLKISFSLNPVYSLIVFTSKEVLKTQVIRMLSLLCMIHLKLIFI